MKATAYATIKKYVSVRQSTGMLLVGALCWIVYLTQVNLMTNVWGMNHFVAEASGIPVSWIINYSLNTWLVFHQGPNWRQFASLCLVSSAGWIPYLATTALFTNALGLHPTIGTIVAVGAKYAWNLLAQQIVTFGRLKRDGS